MSTSPPNPRSTCTASGAPAGPMPTAWRSAWPQLDEMGEVGRIEQVQGREMVWYPLDGLTPAPGGNLVPPMATLQLAGGRKEKIRAGDILGALTVEAGYAADQIGKINVNDVSTYVAVDRRVAGQVLKWLENGRIKGRKVKARLLSD